ncbi:DUF1543 domain-containing protein [Wenzhouxiangella sp. EGI_FJ10305]|uniref:DUF1543 domain-containing protein n=1 Tax=Wenzhouxiangella sp. EGI_FJ10305 TaxID=3243768 RepID=UPI0035D828B1
MATEKGNTPALYVVCLGGRAPGSKVELHDIAFAVGRDLESTHEQLLDQWFGNPEGLHVDAWTRVEQVPGYRVFLSDKPADNGIRLYFVNIGGYAPGELWERHAYALYAGQSVSEVKKRARKELLVGRDSVHRDDLYDVDDILEVRADDWHIHLEADPAAGEPAVTNGYFPVPGRTIAEWRSKQAET